MTKTIVSIHATGCGGVPCSNTIFGRRAYRPPSWPARRVPPSEKNASVFIRILFLRLFRSFVSFFFLLFSIFINLSSSDSSVNYCVYACASLCTCPPPRARPPCDYPSSSARALVVLFSHSRT